MIVAAFVKAQGIQNLSIAKVMTTQLHSQSKALHLSRSLFFLLLLDNIETFVVGHLLMMS